MAELALHIGDRPNPTGYRDGDIIQGFNNVWIQRIHAEHICKADRGLMRVWCNLMCEFRYERLGGAEAQIVRLSDGVTHRFESNKPFMNPFTRHNKPEQMDVELYIQRRIAGGQKFLDGTPGKEIWWGGRNYYGVQSCVDSIWATIEAKTPHNRTQPKYKLWPVGRCDLCEFLFISVDDFSNHERSVLESPQTRPISPDPRNPMGSVETVAKRLHHVRWQDDLGISAATVDKIRDKNITVDRRADYSYGRANIVKMKLQGVLT